MEQGLVRYTGIKYVRKQGGKMSKKNLDFRKVSDDYLKDNDTKLAKNLGLYKFVRAAQDLADTLDVKHAIVTPEDYQSEFKHSIMQQCRDASFAKQLAANEDLRAAFGRNDATNPLFVKENVNPYDDLASKHVIQSDEFVYDFNQQNLDTLLKYDGLELTNEEQQEVHGYFNLMDESTGLKDIVEDIRSNNTDIDVALDKRHEQVAPINLAYSNQQDIKNERNQSTVSQKLMAGRGVGLYIDKAYPVAFTDRNQKEHVGVYADISKRADVDYQHSRFDGQYVVNDSKGRHGQFLDLVTYNHILLLNGQATKTRQMIKDDYANKKSYQSRNHQLVFNGNVFKPDGAKFNNYKINPKKDTITKGAFPVNAQKNNEAKDANIEAKKLRDEAKSHNKNKDNGNDIEP